MPTTGACRHENERICDFAGSGYVASSLSVRLRMLMAEGKKGKKRKNGKPDVRFTQVRWNDGLNDSKDTIPAHSRSPDKNRHDRKKRKHDEIDAPGNRVATGNVIRKG
jgi:hypothetical protein